MSAAKGNSCTIHFYLTSIYLFSLSWKFILLSRSPIQTNRARPEVDSGLSQGDACSDPGFLLLLSDIVLIPSSVRTPCIEWDWYHLAVPSFDLFFFVNHIPNWLVSSLSIFWSSVCPSRKHRSTDLQWELGTSMDFLRVQRVMSIVSED